jgi:hypothetical protein
VIIASHKVSSCAIEYVMFEILIVGLLHLRLFALLLKFLNLYFLFGMKMNCHSRERNVFIYIFLKIEIIPIVIGI